MTSNRIIRDISILFVVIFGVWAIYQTLSMFGGWNEPQLSTDSLSPERVSGDKAFLVNRWDEAIEPYRKLVEDDEFNSTAWFRLGESCWRQFLNIDDGRVLFENEDLEDASTRELSALESLLVDAMAAYESAGTFAQYRNESQARLAEIHVRLGKKAEALKLLDQSLSAGHLTIGLRNHNLLSQLEEFNPVEYGRLKKLEKENHERKRGSQSRYVAF